MVGNITKNGKIQLNGSRKVGFRMVDDKQADASFFFFFFFFFLALLVNPRSMRRHFLQHLWPPFALNIYPQFVAHLYIKWNIVAYQLLIDGNKMF
jgi:hypothetical protein